MPQGKLLYEVTANWKVAEIGQTPLGSRNDFYLDGKTSGEISGKYMGVDYGLVGNDGVVAVHVHETIRTDDGEIISSFRQGYAVPNPQGMYDIKGFVTFAAGSKKYAWLNNTVGVVEAEGNPKGEPNFKAKVYEWKDK